ncbi:aminotransferase-like domain-containing protein [Xylophilus sp.]|uniref:aminotransferase-like domain-containing protein n=1 Tax=Xylophilus sp. TaxID=2653893 RepID=UPI002D8000BB|nr:PLP-dependent aminotransferase family protein [Xylophilus sp.]
MRKRKLRREDGFVIGRADLENTGEEGAHSLVDRIFLRVSAAIRGRRIGTGTRMPSVRQLAQDCQISRDTAARAYDKLVAHGLLESRPGSGYYVRAPAVRSASQQPLARPSLFYPHGLAEVTRLRLALQHPAPGLASQSGIGTLPEDWIAEAGIASALRTVARGSQRRLARHGEAQGYLPLRQQLQLKLQDAGIPAGAANIIVTSGATEALGLVVQAFLRSEGEHVLVEQPCQPLLVDRLMSSGLQPVAVARLDDGPDIDALRTLCMKYRPRYFFCTSVLHNPTGSSMAPHKAFQILRMAEEFDLTIVEDDTYGDLVPHHGGPAATRLAPLDQLQRVIHVGSFSKTLAPGLRVGYLAATAERIEWMATYRALHCIAANSLAERTVYRLLSDGSYRHQCGLLRARLAQAHPAVAEAARAAGLHVGSTANAGLFLWADAGPGVDALALSRRLLEQGHLVAPGCLFSSAHPSFLRLNVAAAQAGGALEAIAALLRQR